MTHVVKQDIMSIVRNSYVPEKKNCLTKAPSKTILNTLENIFTHSAGPWY